MEFNISSLLQALALEVWLRSLEHKQNKFCLTTPVRQIQEERRKGQCISMKPRLSN
jgi:hypothetical protein